MKTQSYNLKNIYQALIFVALFISVALINPANANQQGTTLIVYLASDEELHSEEPNSLSVENGIISIILEDGLKVSFDFEGKEVVE